MRPCGKLCLACLQYQQRKSNEQKGGCRPGGHPPQVQDIQCARAVGEDELIDAKLESKEVFRQRQAAKCGRDDGETSSEPNPA
jgi:hypothetical protein